MQLENLCLALVGNELKYHSFLKDEPVDHCLNSVEHILDWLLGDTSALIKMGFIEDDKVRNFFGVLNKINNYFSKNEAEIMTIDDALYHKGLEIRQKEFLAGKLSSFQERQLQELFRAELSEIIYMSKTKKNLSLCQYTSMLEVLYKFQEKYKESILLMVFLKKDLEVLLPALVKKTYSCLPERGTFGLTEKLQKLTYDLGRSPFKWLGQDCLSLYRRHHPSTKHAEQDSRKIRSKLDQLECERLIGRMYNALNTETKEGAFEAAGVCSELITRTEEMLDEIKTWSRGKERLGSINKMRELLYAELFLPVLKEYTSAKDHQCRVQKSNYEKNDAIAKKMKMCQQVFLDLMPYINILKNNAATDKWAKTACMAFKNSIERVSSKRHKICLNDVVLLVNFIKIAPGIPNSVVGRLYERALLNVFKQHIGKVVSYHDKLEILSEWVHKRESGKQLKVENLSDVTEQWSEAYKQIKQDKQKSFQSPVYKPTSMTASRNNQIEGAGENVVSSASVVKPVISLVNHRKTPQSKVPSTPLVPVEIAGYNEPCEQADLFRFCFEEVVSAPNSAESGGIQSESGDDRRVNSGFNEQPLPQVLPEDVPITRVVYGGKSDHADESLVEDDRKQVESGLALHAEQESIVHPENMIRQLSVAEQIAEQVVLDGGEPVSIGDSDYPRYVTSTSYDPPNYQQKPTLNFGAEPYIPGTYHQKSSISTVPSQVEFSVDPAIAQIGPLCQMPNTIHPMQRPYLNAVPCSAPRQPLPIQQPAIRMPFPRAVHPAMMPFSQPLIPSAQRAAPIQPQSATLSGIASHVVPVLPGPPIQQIWEPLSKQFMAIQFQGNNTNERMRDDGLKAIFEGITGLIVLRERGGSLPVIENQLLMNGFNRICDEGIKLLCSWLGQFRPAQGDFYNTISGAFASTDPTAIITTFDGMINEQICRGNMKITANLCLTRDSLLSLHRMNIQPIADWA
ncbi:hypothetical protein [uncultured Endozoicomonas sp.]|uniref:hypothetical protein n=1 Tax=uncultured Endozoicomonas sp. TaxID=432652 RepID=UPI00262DCB32|nr:hypothetical protein [uncultured Endozoicomonas sp.]